MSKLIELINHNKENSDNINVFVIPALYVLTSIISMKITTKTGNKEADYRIKIFNYKINLLNNGTNFE